MIDKILESLKTFQDDGIDSNVYRCDEIEFGSSAFGKRLYNSTPILNQMADSTTTNACGAFSQCKVINEMNYIEGTYNLNKADPVKFWKRTVEQYGGSYTKGSSLAGNINNAKKSGFISGYYACLTVADMKKALDNGNIICTGSARIDWREAYYGNNIVSFTNNPEFYHLFCIVGYNDEKGLFTIANSRGTDVFDDGLCYIRYSDINYLYSRIACVDTKDTHLLEKVVADRKLLEKAKAEHIWNGERASEGVVRYEAVLMVARKIGIYGTDDEILHEAIKRGIWNGENKYGYAKRYEVALMASRALKVDENKLRNKKDPYANATRGQVILMIMRG